MNIIIRWNSQLNNKPSDHRKYNLFIKINYFSSVFQVSYYIISTSQREIHLKEIQSGGTHVFS